MFIPPVSRLSLHLLLSLAVIALPLAAPAFANSAPAMATAFKGGDFERKISVSITNLPLREAIRLVGQKGRISLVIEDDLKETVNVDFKDVRLGDALQTLLAMGGLQAYWNGNVFAVVSRKKALERGLLASNVRLFPLKHASSARVADFLNTSTLTAPYSGMSSATAGAATGTAMGQQQLQLAKADPRTNTVFVMGSASELAIAERIVEALDRPQEQRIFKLSHAQATHVAALLNASLFNNGNKAAESVSLQVEQETIREGSGAMNTSSGVELSSGQTQIRSRGVQSVSVPVEARQSVAIPDTRTNSVIVMGSPETLSAAEALIPQLDRKLAQVAIDVEVVEVTSRDALELGISASGQVNSVTTSFDPASTTNPGWAVGYDPATFFASSWKAKLNALVQDRRAKVLARPTIIATDNTESQINIVDEVIKGTRLSNSGVNPGTGQNLVVVEPIYGVAGVTLNILPKVGADGTVTLRLHPTVSTIRETQKDSMGNALSLLSRRELIAQQVTVESGKTLSLAGLTQNTRVSTRSKFPILGDIPILGWLFSSTSTDERQTELVIVMTPRILSE